MAATSANERLEKSGFALLKGDNLEVYVRKYMIELGRRSKSTKLDVVLGEKPACRPVSDMLSAELASVTRLQTALHPTPALQETT